MSNRGKAVLHKHRLSKKERKYLSRELLNTIDIYFTATDFKHMRSIELMGFFELCLKELKRREGEHKRIIGGLNERT